jgi:hypothetical protein
VTTLALVKDGWHLAKIANFTVHKDGNITLHFSVEGQTLKAKLSPDKVKLIFQMLALPVPRVVSRYDLQKLVNKQLAIKTETRLFTNGGFTIHYSKVVSIKAKIPEEEVSQEDFFRELLDDYFLSNFGWIKI